MQNTTCIAEHDIHKHIDDVRWKRIAQLVAMSANDGLQLLEEVRGALLLRNNNIVVVVVVVVCIIVMPV